MSFDQKKFEEIFKNVRVSVGLRQQGHMETVERMLSEGKSWDEIGNEIGWVGSAVKEWYMMESTHKF